MYLKFIYHQVEICVYCDYSIGYSLKRVLKQFLEKQGSDDGFPGIYVCFSSDFFEHDAETTGSARAQAEREKQTYIPGRQSSLPVPINSN